MNDKSVAVEDEGKVVEPAPCPWRTDKKTVFKVGGQEFELIQVGVKQKRQLGLLKQFITDSIKPIFDDLGEDVMKRFNEGQVGLSDLVPIIESALDPDIYQKLGELLLMASPEFVEENFDIGWIVDAAETTYKYNYGVKRLVTAFF